MLLEQVLEVVVSDLEDLGRRRHAERIALTELEVHHDAHDPPFDCRMLAESSSEHPVGGGFGACPELALESSGRGDPLQDRLEPAAELLETGLRDAVATGQAAHTSTST